MSQVTVNVFGSPDVRWGEHPLVLPSRRATALLIYLVVEGGTHSRDALAALLWPESDTVQGRTALRKTISRLKAIFKPMSMSDNLFLVAQHTIQLNPDFCIDADMYVLRTAWQALKLHIDAYRTPAELARGDATRLLHRARLATERYRGDFMAGFALDGAPEFEHWASTQREVWHQRADQLFDWLTLLYAQSEKPTRAAEVAAHWVALNPLNERAHRRIIAAYAAAGDSAAAVRAYEACCQTLEAELGVTPESETDALIQDVQSRPVGPVPGIAIKSTPQATPQHNLPISPLPLLGREALFTQVQRQVLSGESRLSTLVGPPGVGKTRLALHVASESLPAFTDGTWFIDLTTIHDPNDTLPVIAQVFGVREAANSTLRDALFAYLRDRHALLLLDNFEHLLDAAPLVADLLAACPHLVILVTSREHLHLRWERRIPVPPLTLPQGDTPDEIAQSQAVKLFVTRAQATDPHFALTQNNISQVGKLCVRLDGLPLAIEQAAAHESFLSPPEMLRMIDHQQGLPPAGIRDLPERHQTLHTAIATSYALLEPTQQALFRQLGVFAGGWTLEAAEAIVGAVQPLQDAMTTRQSRAENPPVGVNLLEALGRLVDHHLVYVIRSDQEAARFNMLETIREYALEQVQQSGEMNAIQQRHTRYFIQLAERAERELRGSKHKIWLQQLEQEYDNVRVALEWSIENGDTEYGLRLRGSLYHFWE